MKTIPSLVYRCFRCLPLLTALTAGAVASVLTGPVTDPVSFHGYYLISPNPWTAAQAEAALLGGNLVTVNNAAEDTFLDTTFGRPGNAWIGLNDATTEGTEVWAGGGISAFRNWAAGEPGGPDHAQRRQTDGLWQMSANTAATGGFDNFGLVEIVPSVINQGSTNTGTLTPGQWKYFRVNIPAASPGWRLVLSATGSGEPDIFVHKEQLPTEGSALKSSTDAPIDTLLFSDSEATAGAWLVGLHVPATDPGNANFTLTSEVGFFRTMTWDAGVTDNGTQILSQPNTAGGFYYHKITAQGTTVGGWRSRLRVTSGTADLYLLQGGLPTPTSFHFASVRAGTTADGMVLRPGQWVEGQDWFLMVSASVGAQWNLLTGEPFVQDMGTLAAAPPATGTIGGEGMRFFKTSVPSTTAAWRLRWTNGMTSDILVRRGQVPFDSGGFPYHADSLRDFEVPVKLLLVPPYLTGETETFFVGVEGDPGTAVSLQSIVQPITDIAFTSSTAVNLTSIGFATFRVQVPVEQIAWEASVVPVSGDPGVCVRRDLVPADWQNDAYSEVTGPTVEDSIVLSPPTLSDGTFFITVFGSGSCTLHSRNPEITTVPYLGATLNNRPLKAGWRFYQVTDIAGQLGTLGWDLVLSNHVPGTDITLRRNAVPSRWFQRSGGNSSAQQGHVDFSSVRGFLQRPGHQADVWYIGIYQPDAPLGAFTLTRTALTAPTVTFNNGTASRTNAVPGRWEFFRIDVPAGVLGWDVRLNNVSAGLPGLVVARNELPDSLGTDSWNPPFSQSWPPGLQWATGSDWTGRTQDATGSVDETGRILAMGMGAPLEPGTYYVGVMPRDENPVTYTLLSRGIGTGQALTVPSINFAGGSSVVGGLPAREARYFSVDVPANMRSWHVRLAQTTGELLLLVQRGEVPNIGAAFYGSADTGEKMQRTGPEHYTLLPPDGQDFITPARYYFGVVSEGVGPSGNLIGSGTAGGTLQSLGELPFTSMGTAAVGVALTQAVTLEGGECKVFRFTVPAGLPSVVVAVDNVTAGAPFAVTVPGLRWPRTDFTSGQYGMDDGESTGRQYVDSATPLTIPNPVAGTYSILVKAGFNPDPDNAACTLRVEGQTPVTIPFEGGTRTETGHPPQTWRYLRVVVPSSPLPLGWTVRLKDIAGGTPRLAATRDKLPEQLGDATDVNGPWQPAGSSSWPSGHTRAADSTYAGRGRAADDAADLHGTELGMGMGRPLEPGTYFLGVFNNSTTTAADYTVQSRGIGPGRTLPVTSVAFTGGSVNITALPSGEVSFFSVSVPANVRGWKMRLNATAGESSMRLLKDFVPDTRDLARGPFTDSPGQWYFQTGTEHAVVTARDGEEFVPAGLYFFAVASEGDNALSSGHLGPDPSSAQLVSNGELPHFNFGSITAGATAFRDDTLEGGETKAYRFTVPAGLSNVRVELEDVTGGQPLIAWVPGIGWPVLSSSYGAAGGQNLDLLGGDQVNRPTPVAGTHSLLVTALNNVPAVYRLRVTGQGIGSVAFDGGTQTESAHPSGTWRYFQITVPPGALGWDIRLTNVAGGQPLLCVRRDLIPPFFGNSPGGFAGHLNSWESGHQWAADLDWTRYPHDPSSQPEHFRVLGMGMGRPLEPGTYIAGIYNNGNDDTAYSLRSRGIGAGFTYPVTPLPFSGGSAPISGLPAREMKFYSVDVPADTPTWRLRLTPSAGQLTMLILKDFLPNVDAESYASSTGQSPGSRTNKAGLQFFSLLPAHGQTILAAGRYYIAVVSAGLNPSAGNIGNGSASGTLSTLGPLPVTDLGALTAGTDIVRNDSALGAEVKLFRFTMPAGVVAAQLTLENRVGEPGMSAAPGTVPPVPGSGNPQSAEGYDGGQHLFMSDRSIITLRNPASGAWTIALRGDADNTGSFPDASYRLRVKVKPFVPLSFDAVLNGGGVTHTDSRAVQNQESTFYTVNVPAIFEGGSALGWRLRVATTLGNVNVYAHKGFADLPQGVQFNSGQAIIAPPWFTPGTWFVEVRGNGNAEYTLTSEAVRLHQPAFTLGTTPNTQSGDTGEVDLEQGGFHFYALNIPNGNLGLVRTVLESISGNPDLVIRAGRIPTGAHGVTGPGDPNRNYDRYSSGTGTEYGNWVPFDGRTERQITPGTWYLSVNAAGASNCRYRLRLHTGNITDLALNGGAPPNLSIAAGDWRHYRVTLPLNAPQQWLATYSQSLGDVTMYVRDTVPGGNGQHSGHILDWESDGKNQGPYGRFLDPGTHTLTTPPLRPASTYFLSFLAHTDSTINVSSATAGGTAGPFAPLAFYGGSVTNVPVSAGGSVLYRISVPPEATRLLLQSTHGSDIVVSLEQGAPVDPARGAHFRDAAQDLFLNLPITSTWPWVPGFDYYVRVDNNGASSATFNLSIDGRNALTDDNDNDGMADAWETLAYGSLNNGDGAADNNGDGLANILHYGLGGLPGEAGGDGGLSDSGARFTVSLTGPPGAERLRIAFRVPQTVVPRLRLIVEAAGSTDGTWTTLAIRTGSGAWAGPASVALGAPSGGFVAVTVTDTAAGVPRRFGRVSASATP